MTSLTALRVGGRRVWFAVALVALCLLLAWRWGDFGSSTAKAGRGNTNAGVAIDVAPTTRANVPVYLEGLGTVRAFYTVTVTARVDGQLTKVAFTEGQAVKRGDLLAQIDPRPYQAAYDLAVATKEKDIAQLANARADLKRYADLAVKSFASKQQLDTQQALVAQFEAQIKADQASIDNARTQLDYTTITSPIDGVTGVRLVDPGNNVHATGTAGIVVVAQLQPISVLFTLPEEALPTLSEAMAGRQIDVAALSRDDATELDRGTLAVIDNQIDQTTGTIRLKATFPNGKRTLWPGQFVNARVLIDTRQNALTVPSAAIQRGPQGTFVYLLKPDSTVAVQPVKIGTEIDNKVVIESGLKEGDQVAVSNQYRLEVGAHVRVNSAPASKPTVVGERDK